MSNNRNNDLKRKPTESNTDLEVDNVDSNRTGQEQRKPHCSRDYLATRAVGLMEPKNPNYNSDFDSYLWGSPSEKNVKAIKKFSLRKQLVDPEKLNERISHLQDKNLSSVSETGSVEISSDELSPQSSHRETSLENTSEQNKSIVDNKEEPVNLKKRKRNYNKP